MAATEYVKIYVGADMSQMLAVKVLEYSIGKHASVPYKVYPLLLDLPVPKNKRNLQRTGFSFSRFAIPELNGYKGKAIYMDADMLVFGDIKELWQIPFNGAKILIQEELPSIGRQIKRNRQTSVCILDCAALDWNVYKIIGGLESEYNYSELMVDLCIVEDKDIGCSIPFKWNSLEFWDETTCNLHYTDMNMQPWVTPVNKNGYLWVNTLREMLEKNRIQKSEIENSIIRGYVRPSLREEIYAQDKAIDKDRLLSIDNKNKFIKHKLANEALKERKKIQRSYILESIWSKCNSVLRVGTTLPGTDQGADKWHEVQNILEQKELANRPPLRVWTLAELESIKPKIVLILLDLVQDLEIMKPIIVAFQRSRETCCKVVVSNWLEKQSPRVTSYLESIGQQYSVINSRQILKTKCQGVLDQADFVLFPSESNLPPHKLAHHMAKNANSLGITTITFQHGLENIGLSYFDNNKVEMASGKIITWNERMLANPKINKVTLGKCVPLGMFKPVYEQFEKPRLLDLIGEEHVVGVFENLHWGRYDDSYREDFMKDLEAVARERKDILFLIKPHHAGQWLSKGKRTRFENLGNIKIIDVTDPIFEKIPGNQLVTICDCVITTPSTIAVDAAITGVPVAIIANKLDDLESYTGLRLLRSGRDWIEFLDNSLEKPEQTLSNIESFLRNTFKKLNPTEDLLAMINGNQEGLLKS